MGLFDSPRALPGKHALTHTTTAASQLPMALERGALSLVIVAAALWLWQKISERGAKPRDVKACPNYAAYVGVSDTQLDDYRTSQVCVVHHDDQGRILAIKTGPDLPPITTAPSAPPAPVQEPELARAA